MFDPVDSDDEFDDATGGVPVEAVVEPAGFGARHRGRFAALATGPGQQFGRFTALVGTNFATKQTVGVGFIHEGQVDPLAECRPQCRTVWTSCMSI